MDFGVTIPSSWDAKKITECALTAEESGLDFFLTSDHYFGPDSNASVDAWIMLASIASITKKIMLGTCVTPIPFRPPQILAKIVATVDEISKGRAILGVGAGWNQREFEAYSTWDSVGVRVAKTAEGVNLITKLWTSKSPFDFNGKYYKLKGAILEPKPVQKPHPQLWFGTQGDYMLSLASKYASAWLPPIPKIGMDTYQRVLSKLGGKRGKGRRPIKVMFSGDLVEIRNGIDQFVEMGCKGAILIKTPHDQIVPAIKKFAKEIIPSYR